MSEQLDLLTYGIGPGARITDAVTSHQAADRNLLLRRHDRVECLLAHYHNPRGLTDFELADIVGRQQTSAGKRRGELRDAGLIVETDERRAAPSGSPAIVWRINDAGIAAARMWVMKNARS